MPINPDSIQDPSSTVPANSEEDSGGLSPDLLEIPLMRGLLEGAPAAVWTPIGTKGPEVATVLKHAPELNRAGFGFFRDEKEKIDVFYNSRFISPELVKKAAEKGKTKDIASPLGEVSAQINGAVGEASGVAEPGVGGTPSSVPTDSPLNTQRVNNLSPGGPTSGPLPGAGRLLNSIVTPTV